MPVAAPPSLPGVRDRTDAIIESADTSRRGVLAAKTVTTSATVEAVDLASRLVTLRADDGVRLQKTAAPDVDLGQVQPGDRVTVKEIASVAVSVTTRALATAPAERSVVVETSEPGEKPARLTVETEEIDATVAAIEYATRTAVLTNPDGSTRTVEVDPRVDLDEINVGDQVKLRITKAVALSVESPR